MSPLNTILFVLRRCDSTDAPQVTTFAANTNDGTRQKMIVLTKINIYFVARNVGCARAAAACRQHLLDVGTEVCAT